MKFIGALDGNYYRWFCNLALEVHPIFEEVLSARALKGYVRSCLSRGRSTAVIVIAYSFTVDCYLKRIYFLTLCLEIIGTFLGVCGVSEIWNVTSSCVDGSVFLLRRLVYQRLCRNILTALIRQQESFMCTSHRLRYLAISLASISAGLVPHPRGRKTWPPFVLMGQIKFGLLWINTERIWFQFILLTELVDQLLLLDRFWLIFLLSRLSFHFHLWFANVVFVKAVGHLLRISIHLIIWDYGLAFHGLWRLMVDGGGVLGVIRRLLDLTISKLLIRILLIVMKFVYVLIRNSLTV